MQFLLSCSHTLEQLPPQIKITTNLPNSRQVKRIYEVLSVLKPYALIKTKHCHCLVTLTHKWHLKYRVEKEPI